MKNKHTEYPIDKSRLAKNVKKAQSGSQKAFEAIVNDTKNYIYFYCLSLLKNEDEAAEAVQDIFIILFQKLDTIEKPEAFLGWLKVVSANYCKNKLSKRCSDTSYDDSILTAEDEICTQLTPEKSVEAEELCSLITVAVDELPVFQRECILLYYYQQMNISQISAALGVKEGTVKSRLFNARKALKSKLEKYGNDILSLGAASPTAYISYALNKSSEKFNISSPINLKAAVPVGKTDSSSLLAYAVSLTPTAAKTFSVLKAAAAITASTLVIGGIAAHSVMNNTVSSPDTAIEQTESVAEQALSTTEPYYQLINGELTEEQAVYFAIKGIEDKLQKRETVKGINYPMTDEYIKGKNITYGVDLHSLPVTAKLIKADEPYWVVVFANGQTDVTKKITEEISWDRVSSFAIEKGLIWQDENGNILYHTDYEVFYYIAEINALNGDMQNYRFHYYTGNKNENIEEPVDDYLKDIYNTEFNANSLYPN